jgi:hypothetical protein
LVEALQELAAHDGVLDLIGAFVDVGSDEAREQPGELLSARIPASGKVGWVAAVMASALA